MGGFNLGSWLVGAGKAIGKELQHAAVGVTDIVKSVVNQPVALAHELSGAVQGLGHSAVGLAHEAGGTITGVSQALTMPLMVAGGAALVFMLTQRR
jgi:hypothetical protein